MCGRWAVCWAPVPHNSAACEAKLPHSEQFKALRPVEEWLLLLLGKQLFCCKALDRGVWMVVRWGTTCLLLKLVAALQVHTAALDAAVAASAAGQQTPFSSLLEGSAEDSSLDDVRDYFCYAQIYSQVSIYTACNLAGMVLAWCCEASMMWMPRVSSCCCVRQLSDSHSHPAHCNVGI